MLRDKLNQGGFLGYDTKNTFKKQDRQMRLHKILELPCYKGTNQQNEEITNDMEKKIANHGCKGFISKIYKKFLQLNSKNKNCPIKNEQKPRIENLPEIHK